MDWDYDLLWEKSKRFIIKAHTHEQNDPDFQLWCALGLELLARASLAKVHPALLADASDGNNVLYAFGFSAPDQQPHSIGMKAVLDRCVRVVPKFDVAHHDFCLKMVERRNAELHSASNAFSSHEPGKWQHLFYATVRVLLEHQSKSLADYLPAPYLEIATEMLRVDQAKVRDLVRSNVKLHKDDFFRRTPDERAQLWARGKESAGALRSADGQSWAGKCPACGGDAIFSGKATEAGAPFYDGDGIKRQRYSVLPNTVACAACGLRLLGFEKLQSLDLGGVRNYETLVSDLNTDEPSS